MGHSGGFQIVHRLFTIEVIFFLFCFTSDLGLNSRHKSIYEDPGQVSLIICVLHSFSWGGGGVC